MSVENVEFLGFRSKTWRSFVAALQAVLGSSAKSTHSTLEISFTHLSPLDDALDLNAAVTVNNQYSSSSTFSLSREIEPSDFGKT